MAAIVPIFFNFIINLPLHSSSPGASRIGDFQSLHSGNPALRGKGCPYYKSGKLIGLAAVGAADQS
jgi:hypothetical protein